MHLRSLVAVLLVALLARPALGQGGAPPAGIRRPSSSAAAADSARRAATATSLVRGVVFDSIASAPLVGAAVQLVVDDTSRFTRTERTDSLGSFAFPDVSAGRYLIGFFHPLLDSLEIEPPVQRVQVAGRPTVLVDLAVPSGQRLLAAFCGAKPPTDSSGALVGWLRDADTDAPIADGRVVLTWSQLVVDARGLRVDQRRLPTRSRPSGMYVACDLPGDTQMLADADAAGGRRSGLVDVRVPARGLRRLDLALADSASAAPAPVAASAGARAAGTAPSGEPALRGTARLTGTVLDATSRAVPRASVTVRGAASTAVTTDDGTFVLAGLPAGTRSVQVRAIGYEPRSVVVRLASGKTATTRLVLDKRVDVLAAVNVVGKSVERTRDVTGFDQRRRMGTGNYLTREEIEKRNPLLISDALRTVPGLQIAPGGPGQNRILGRGGCSPAVFVDGMQVVDGAKDLDAVVRPMDVRGIEVYRGGANTPPEYASNSSCGTILVWTGR